MTMRCAAVVLLAGLAGTAFAADGLRPPEGDSVWPRWQMRAQVGPTTLSPLTLAAPEAGSLLGDYYFDTPGWRVPSLVGGLRATSGLAITGRGLPLGTPSSLRLGHPPALPPAPFADDAADTLPYLGFGYSAATRDGAWRFSADIGLVADRPGGLRAGRQLQGDHALDGALGDLRIAPVLQLGVSYAF